MLKQRLISAGIGLAVVGTTLGVASLIPQGDWQLIVSFLTGVLLGIGGQLFLCKIHDDVDLVDMACYAGTVISSIIALLVATGSF